MKKLLKLSALLMAAVMTASVFGGCSQKASVETLPQFEREIKEGEEIAVITVKGYGEMKVRFFPEEAPKAVENFITHAKNGYYDELNFHRVLKNFMIQGGDPKGDGTGGESIWSKSFENEIADNLRHFRGAISMANSGTDGTNGSQFFIIQNHTRYTDKLLEQYTTMADKVRDKYKEIGGAPQLDGGYTVFAQVYEGLDVLDKIAECKVKAVYSSNGQSENSKPVEEVLIQKIEILPYKK